MSANPSQAPAPSGRHLRVLYAEDVRELREVVRMTLTLEGHSIECQNDGQLAWDRVRAAPDAFDLIITDHHMPVMNGLEFVIQLRALPFRGKIMVFSSDLRPDTAVLYRELKVDRILNKPVMPTALRQVLGELFPGGAPGG